MKTQRSGKTKVHIHQAEQRGNCGKTANKRAKEDQSYFNRVCLYRVLSPPLPVSGDKNVPLLLVSSTWAFYLLLWQPTPVFLPGKSHRQRSLIGYSPWGCKESDTTEQIHFHQGRKRKTRESWLHLLFLSSFTSKQPTCSNDTQKGILPSIHSTKYIKELDTDD